MTGYAKIADTLAESNFKIIKENLEYLVDDTENLNCIRMWKLKKKICKKNPDVPTGKKNLNGEIVIVSPSEVVYMISEAVLNVEIATHTRSQQTLSKFREQYSRYYHVQSR